MLAVADSKILNLLVVEDDLEDEQLLCEALIEIEENRQWCNWRSANIVQVDQLADALDCMRLQHFDAVLLNLSLPDSPALLETFLEARSCAEDTPIIVLADEEDENLANRLVRCGAEDVLQKTELECNLLARSIRYAVERRRRSLDSPDLGGGLTGVLSRQTLKLVAPHFLRLVFSSHIDTQLAILDITNLPAATSEDREARELFLMRAADVLEDSISVPALIARVEKCRFAVILPGLIPSEAEALVAGAAEEIEEVLQPLVSANVDFTIQPLSDPESLETVLNDTRLSGRQDDETLCCLKPVMLAD